jgi:tight adherence protein B
VIRARALAALVAVGALVLPGSALAATDLQADASTYPNLRLTFVGERQFGAPPVVTENGERVEDVSATNLGRAKSVVLAVDRSRSMNGEPLAEAVEAAGTFVAQKLQEDRISVVTFATTPVQLSGFSTGTIDADTALRSISVDDVAGTTLYDGVVLSADALAAESLPGRVIILVTDGNETRSKASLDAAIKAARDAGAVVHVVAIESGRFSPAPLQKLASETGGSYYETGTLDELTAVYRTIAEELTRTWRLEYVTRALPGEPIGVSVQLPGEKPETLDLRAPGEAVSTDAKASDGPLPDQLFASAWGRATFAFIIGLIVLLASAVALRSPRGAWVKSRLAPHVTERRKGVEQGERGRLALVSALFGSTENALGHLKPWKRLQALLERADMPLRTVEFFYLILGSGLVLGSLAGLISGSAAVFAVGLAAGGLLPYLVVSVKARKRVKAFENQLPDMLATMGAGLKAGHSFRQALQSVVDEDQPPASKEFKRVLAEARLGRPLDEAMVAMAQRLGSKNFEYVINAVTIQRQAGGSLAGLFDMVGDTVRRRQVFAKKIKALTAMGRGSAYVLVGLPVFVATALTVINAEYMHPLWHTGTGHKLLAMLAVMMLLGSLMLKKIVNFRY